MCVSLRRVYLKNIFRRYLIITIMYTKQKENDEWKQEI